MKGNNCCSAVEGGVLFACGDAHQNALAGTLRSSVRANLQILACSGGKCCGEEGIRRYEVTRKFPSL